MECNAQQYKRILNDYMEVDKLDVSEAIAKVELQAYGDWVSKTNNLTKTGREAVHWQLLQTYKWLPEDLQNDLAMTDKELTLALDHRIAEWKNRDELIEALVLVKPKIIASAIVEKLDTHEAIKHLSEIDVLFDELERYAPKLDEQYKYLCRKYTATQTLPSPKGLIEHARADLKIAQDMASESILFKSNLDAAIGSLRGLEKFCESLTTAM